MVDMGLKSALGNHKLLLDLQIGLLLGKQQGNFLLPRRKPMFF